ncbi:GNAT family N-acetyltransferase [Patescibacteria group bacterium]|nr:GNAT family N-acetyltransferase [Patescibacteria group bacterium]MBU2259688.1 GNAT family N-acetyltransferase [Patescibacteria group bacterium]
MTEVTIKFVPISEVLAVIDLVPEFDESKHQREQEYQKRIANKDPLIVVVFIDKKPAGFLIAYDKYSDGSYYCWRTGVIPEFRRKGVFSALMSEFTKVAKEKGYSTMKIITRNNRREMLTYLVKEGWCFIEMIPKETVEDSRMLLMKKI